MNAHIATRALRRKHSTPDTRNCVNNDEDRRISEDEMATTTNSHREGKPTKAKRCKRLSTFEFSQVIVQKGLENRTDVLAFAQMQKKEGKTDIAEFILNRGVKVVNDAIHTAWYEWLSHVWKFCKGLGRRPANASQSLCGTTLP